MFNNDCEMRLTFRSWKCISNLAENMSKPLSIFLNEEYNYHISMKYDIEHSERWKYWLDNQLTRAYPIITTAHMYMYDIMYWDRIKGYYFDSVMRENTLMSLVRTWLKLSAKRRKA